MAYLVCCGPTLTPGIVMLIFMVGNQGVANLYTHICAYPPHSVREARGWIGWRLGRGFRIRPSRCPIHNFIGSNLIPIPLLLSLVPFIARMERRSRTLSLNLLFNLICYVCPDVTLIFLLPVVLTYLLFNVIIPCTIWRSPPDINHGYISRDSKIYSCY
jgi:hypothetical protein